MRVVQAGSRTSYDSGKSVESCGREAHVLTVCFPDSTHRSRRRSRTALTCLGAAYDGCPVVNSAGSFPIDDGGPGVNPAVVLGSSRHLPGFLPSEQGVSCSVL